jgi:hypothetical protein
MTNGPPVDPVPGEVHSAGRVRGPRLDVVYQDAPSSANGTVSPSLTNSGEPRVEVIF